MNFEPANLERLIDRYFDSDLSPAEKADLERQLVTSDAARKLFWERAGIHTALESWADSEAGLQVAATLPLVEDAPVHVAPKRFRQPALWLAAAAVIALLIGLSTLLQQSGSRDGGAEHLAEQTENAPRRTHDPADGQVPVAYLSRTAEVRWKSGDGPRPGEAIFSKQMLEVESGLVELDLYSGARIVAAGPARIRPESDMRVSVEEGRIEVDVGASARGLEVLVPGAQIVDLGTRFRVDTQPDAGSIVQVIEGSVEVRENATATVRRLGQGETAYLPLRPGVTLKPSPIGVPIAELDARNTREGAAQQAAWRKHVEQMARDPSLLVYFPFQPEDPSSRILRNRVANENSPESGTIVAAAWGSGRWLGKSALSFRNPSDRVRLDIPGEYSQVTFIASVRPDDLPRRYNGLFFSEFGIPGETHWQLSNEGQFTFGVRPKDRPDAWTFHRAFSGRVIEPREYGTWILLATTYDAGKREVIHYVDGQPVHREVLPETVPIRFGRATLGNFFDPAPQERSSTQGFGEQWSYRNWTGLIDEFALYARTLSPEEIRTWSKSTRP